MVHLMRKGCKSRSEYKNFHIKRHLHDSLYNWELVKVHTYHLLVGSCCYSLVLRSNRILHIKFNHTLQQHFSMGMRIKESFFDIGAVSSIAVVRALNSEKVPKRSSRSLCWMGNHEHCGCK
jgi:hypothetical protein